MKDFLTRLSKARFPYEPLIKIELSRSRLTHNLNEFRKIAPKGGIAPVLKSNAYGHGLVEVARVLERSDLAFMVVDSYFEAVALRSSGVKAPLLVIGYSSPETIACARLRNTAFAVTSMETLRELVKAEVPPWIRGLSAGQICFGASLIPHSHRIHLKIDTGMRRQGIMPEEIPEAIDFIKHNPLIVLEGVCSHLSDSDNAGESSNGEQILVWNRAVKQFKAAFPSLKYAHLSNTGGHRFTGDIQANVSRLGLGLYGLIDGSLFKPALDLKPVMEMKTVITGVKKLRMSETVGYGNSFKATKNMTIATIPVGYYEGLDRRLSSERSGASRGFILTGSSRKVCRIIGRVSMNITVIEVSTAPEVQIGTEVIIFSNNPSDPNSIREIALQCETIPYEIAVKIPAHLKRVVVE